jgi:hypothetical protein
MSTAQKVLILYAALCLMVSASTAASSEVTTPTQGVASVVLRAKIDEKRELSADMAYLTQPGAEVKITLLGKPAAEAAATQPQSEGTIDASSPKHYKIVRQQSLEWSFGAGTLARVFLDGIVWKAPDKPGAYTLEAKSIESRFFEDASQGAALPAQAGRLRESPRSDIGSLRLTMLVQHPLEKETRGVIDSYPIGIYPDENSPTASAYVAQHRSLYAPPKYFVKVTPDTKNLLISEHFRLGDFSPASERDQVHYIALDYRLVDKLEAIIARAQKRGMKVTALKILRAYLSPMELDRMRRAGIVLSGTTRYIYGDAAAIIVDENSDGKMDDLNNDQVVDVKDAQVLADLAEEVERDTHVYGGVGVYGTFEDKQHPATPYVHVDTRGVRSRWGQSAPAPIPGSQTGSEP